MTWNIATAKQQFSEVVRLVAEAPQAIYNRDKPVAVMVSPEEFEKFRAWSAQQGQPSLAHLFAQIRQLLAEEGSDGLDLPARADRAAGWDDHDDDSSR